MPASNAMPLVDLAPQTHSIAEDVVDGLTRNPKRLSSKYFYDQRGSELFDAICELPEYYPTRTELWITRRYLEEMADVIGEESCIIEIGSGSSLKTEMLLDALARPSAYVPIDISREHLLAAAEKLAERHSAMEVFPVCADFLQPIALPGELPECQNYVIYFPGSTLGNLTKAQAGDLLAELATLARRQSERHSQNNPGRGGLLLGVDLQKNVDVLEAAYNDAQGITARFNLNILHHINRRLGCNIPVDAYRHHAPYVWNHQRIEMHLVAQRDHQFEIGDNSFKMQAGQSILTEYSHKYKMEELTDQLAAANWVTQKIWTDPQNYFALLYCSLDQ